MTRSIWASLYIICVVAWKSTATKHSYYNWKEYEADDGGRWVYEKFGEGNGNQWNYEDFLMDHGPHDNKGLPDENNKASSNTPQPDPWIYRGNESSSMWNCLYESCRGDMQSPINIDTEAIQINPSMGPIEFTNYDEMLENLTIENTGYNLLVKIPKSKELTIKGGGLQSTYRLSTIEFYWGDSNYRGSQHTVDSKHFPLEVVLTHVNTKYDKPVDEPDAGLSLSVLFKLMRHDNEKIKSIFNSLDKVDSSKQISMLSSPFRVKDLLPRIKGTYVKYSGSLLVPPCHEIITWIIFHHCNKISEKQLSKLRKTKTSACNDKSEKQTTKPTRSVQALNDRKIESTPRSWWQGEYYSFSLPPSPYGWW